MLSHSTGLKTERTTRNRFRSDRGTYEVCYQIDEKKATRFGTKKKTLGGRLL